MRLLLGQTRLLSVPRPKRLAALLEDSRKYQNEVSERLAEQVLHSLYELLRGFQAAHDTSKGELLHEPLADNPDEVYRGLLTVVLRLVFLLYAEERDMLPQDETFLGASGRRTTPYRSWNFASSATIRGARPTTCVCLAIWVDAVEDQRREWLRHGIVPLDYPNRVAADWPELLAIVEERVKPDRMKVNRKVRRDYWWRYSDRQPALYHAIGDSDHVLAISSVGQQAAFARLPSATVYSHALMVFPLPTNAAFCVLQSRPHEIWARFLGSSMKDDLRYTPSDCFETFPFPDAWNTHPDIERVGTNYYDYRADRMVRHGEGLTKTYNRFHDPDETDPEVARLRDLHTAMDRAVLDAYGWTDIPTDCEFLLDYEIDEEDWGTRKKPYRYRWPDDVRDEVLARLLELNAERSEAELRAGGATRTTSPGAGGRRPRSRVARSAAPPTTPAPGTLWNDNPLDHTDSGGNPDGIET